MQGLRHRDELRQHAAAFEAELQDTQAISLGTTIMAATYGEGLTGGVVLGADTRTSSGNYIANRATDKITQLTDKIFMCRSGSAADTQNLCSYVQYYLHQHCMDLDREADVKTAAKLAKLIAYNNKDMLQAGLIVAGWDAQKGGTVWGVPLGGTLVEQPFTIGGSGSAYIYGYCDQNWKPNMNEEQCKAFVVQSVSHAMARDGSSGGNIRTVVINSTGIKKEFLDGTKVPVHYGEMMGGSMQAAPLVA